MISCGSVLQDCKEKILDSFFLMRYDNNCSVRIPVYRKERKFMEKIVEQGILYDFYGELLTEHQRRIYEDAVYNDMSLSEIAEQAGISRQGVHDLIRRCDRTLADYEEKLHLVRRFSVVKEKVRELESLAKKDAGSTSSRIVKLAEEILEEL